MTKNNLLCECRECILRDLIAGHLPLTKEKRFCQSKEQKLFKEKEIIVQQGEPIDNFFYVKSGLVKIYRRDNNDRNTQIIAIASPFDYSTLLTLFHSSYYSYSISALEETTICIFPLDMIKNIIIENGELGIGLLTKFSRATDDIINGFININKRNLRGRIAYILLDFTNNIYKTKVFDVPISRKEIAQLIGMTAENVIRILSEFRNEKIIRINGKEIEVLDIERLQLISDHG